MPFLARAGGDPEFDDCHSGQGDPPPGGPEVAVARGELLPASSVPLQETYPRASPASLWPAVETWPPGSTQTRSAMASTTVGTAQTN